MSQKDRKKFFFNVSTFYSKIILAENLLVVAGVKLTKESNKCIFSDLSILDLEGTSEPSCHVLAHLTCQSSPLLPCERSQCEDGRMILFTLLPLSF